MSINNLRNVNIGFADSPAVDAFGRLRVAQPHTLFDSKLYFDGHPIAWDTELNGGSSTANWNSGTYLDLVCAGTVGDFAIRQTRMRFNYQAGKSFQYSMTGVLFPEAGYIKRFGYFNTNTVTPFDSNRDGIYLEADGTTVYLCQASNGTVTRVAQSSWNGDKFDGVAGSVHNMDWSKMVVFTVDFEWLSGGDVRAGFYYDGMPVVAHTFRNTNTTDAPYMRVANHSMRYEIRGNGGAGTSTLREICGTANSEGGYQEAGQLYSADRGITAFTTAATTSIFPLLSIRLRSGREEGNVIPDSMSILNTTNADFRWAVILNPTVGGVDAASWVNVGGSSAVEYDISRSAVNTLSGGTVLKAGYHSTSATTSPVIIQDLRSLLRMGTSINGTADELVLAIQNLSGAAESYYGSLNWSEPI